MDLFIKPSGWNEILQNRTWKGWVQKIIILGVLMLSGGMAALGTQERLLQALFLVCGGVGIVLVLQRPVIGLFGILVGAFFTPYTGPGGLNLAVLGAAAVSGVWIADMLIRERRLKFAEPRTTFAIAIFIVSAALSFVVGQFPWYPLARQAPLLAQAGGLVIFILSGLAFLAVGNIIRDLRWLRAFTWFFMAVGALYIVALLVPSVANIMRHYFQFGAFTGSIFWVWLLVIPFSQSLINCRLKPMVRIALAIFVLVTLYVAVIQTSDWKSGYIPPLVGLAVILALRLGRRAVWFLPLALIGAILLINQAVATDQYSTFTRLEAWKIVLQLSAASPVFGLGFGNYYWCTPLIAINGWYVNFNSHSQFIDILSQTGIIGLLAFGGIFLEIGRLGWRLRDRAPEGFARAYIDGALGGLAGTLAAGAFGDWILPFIYNVGMNGFRSSILAWLFLGGIVAIHQIVEKQTVSANSGLPTSRLT